MFTCTTVSSACITVCRSNLVRRASLKGIKYIPAVWMTQFAIVLHFKLTPCRFHICSCQYSGSASAYFFTMMSVTMEAEASAFLYLFKIVLGMRSTLLRNTHRPFLNLGRMFQSLYSCSHFMSLRFLRILGNSKESLGHIISLLYRDNARCDILTATKRC